MSSLREVPVTCDLQKHCKTIGEPEKRYPSMDIYSLDDSPSDVAGLVTRGRAAGADEATVSNQAHPPNCWQHTAASHERTFTKVFTTM